MPPSRHSSATLSATGDLSRPRSSIRLPRFGLSDLARGIISSVPLEISVAALKVLKCEV